MVKTKLVFYWYVHETALLYTWTIWSGHVHFAFSILDIKYNIYFFNFLIIRFFLLYLLIYFIFFSLVNCEYQKMVLLEKKTVSL